MKILRFLDSVKILRFLDFYLSCVRILVSQWLLVEGKRRNEFASLRSKRFRAGSSRKVGTRAKKRNDEGGGGERRKRLPANPLILKNCVRPRTQLLIGTVLVVLIT